MSLSKFFKSFGVYLLIFFIAFAIRTVGIIKKETVMFDTPVSFHSPVSNNLLHGKKFKKNCIEYDFETGKIYTGKELKKAFFEHSTSLKDIARDIKTLYKNPPDKIHQTLYYSILRVWNAGFDGLNSKEIINRDCALNMVFFTISFFFMLKLLALIRDDKKFISLSLFFGYVCTGSLSNTFMIREYALSEMLLVIATYICLIIFNRIRSENTKLSVKEFILFSFMLALFSLTGYFVAIYEGLLFLGLLITAIVCKKYKFAAQLFILPAAALLFVFAFCPYYFSFGNFDYTHDCTNVITHVNVMLTRFIESLETLTSYLGQLIYYQLFLLAVIGFYAANVMKFSADENKFEFSGRLNFAKKELCTIFTLLGIACLWIFLVMLISPRVHTRFILPVVPLLGMFLAVIIYNLKNSLIAITTTLYLLCSFIPVISDINIKYVTGSVTNLYDTSRFRIENPEKLPIVILKRHWSIHNVILYLRDDDKVVFEDVLPKPDYKFDKFLLVSSRADLKFLNWPEAKRNEFIENRQHTGIYIVYTIDKEDENNNITDLNKAFDKDMKQTLNQFLKEAKESDKKHKKHK